MDVPSPVVTIMADARSSSVRSASQLGQMTEIRQELHPKTWEKWMLILLFVTVWPIVNVRRMQSPETEIMLICWNNSRYYSKISYFVAGFTNFPPLCTGWLQPRFHSLYRVLSALTVITIFVGYKPSKRSFGISIFVETLIASNPTGRIFVFERCARESTLKYAGCARGLFFREKNACDGGKIQYPKKIY